MPALCLALSAALLVTSLVYAARCAACSDRAARTKEAVEQLRTENARLRAECACSLNLREVERYAREELGMEHLSAEQMVRLEEAPG